MKNDGSFEHRIARAKELLKTARHAAMATVNEDGSPHNTPYFFMYDDKLEHLYWGSHPDSQHSRNIARTGQVFVVVYDMLGRGGLYVRADEAHELRGEELIVALAVNNKFRAREDKVNLNPEYYKAPNPQRMYSAVPTNFWIVMSERDSKGLVVRDFRQEIKAGDLLDSASAIDMHKAGGIIIKDRKVLVERSKGKEFFIHPGGKLEEGETPRQALVRELKEEFQIDVDEADLEPFGTFSAEAANQPGKWVKIDQFIVKKWRGEIRPDNEVEEMLWIDSNVSTDLKLGSIFRTHAIPELKKIRLID